MVIDVSGLDRLLGNPRAIGEELRRTAASRGLRIHVAVAATRMAALVLARARPGLTVVERGQESDALAPIAIGILGTLGKSDVSGLKSDQTSDFKLQTFKSWGLRTLGDLAALQPSALAARLGRQGLLWQTLARGQDIGPLVPALPEERFESSMELEWPIEGLEPLSFVLTRLLEPLSTRLERRDRGVAVLYVELGLVHTHDIQTHPTHPTDQTSVYTRSLQLPTPMRDVRTLRTLILLDLESHPPGAPVERVAIAIDPTPGRIVQHTLFRRALPTPEQLSTLLARLNALMGEDRVGSPALVDSYRPGAFVMTPFKTDHEKSGESGRSGRESQNQTHPTHQTSEAVVSNLRRCRQPVPARVASVGGRPAVVTTDRRGFTGGHVLACAGPWRTSGHWWESSPVISRQSSVNSNQSPISRRSGRLPTGDCRLATGDRRLETPWNRDEWDVSLSDGAVYRIFQDRVTEGWFIDAIVD